MTDSRKPVFLVIGAGAGIGGNAAMRFAAGGYHAVLARRSDEEGLALLKAYKARGIPTVAVFLSGRPLWVNREINAADAFVAAWLPGSEGAGVADVLFGARPATGRLSFSWPAQCDGTPLNSAEGALFPLGYGLNLGTNAPLAPLDETCAALTADTGAVWFANGKLGMQVQAVADNALLPDLRGAGNGITATGLDRRAQEDARKIAFTPGAKLTLTGPASDAAWRITYQVTARPGSAVTVTAGGKVLDITQGMSVAEGKGWREMVLSAKCLGTTGGKLTFGADGSYTSGFYHNLRNFDANWLSGYALFNARIGWEDDSERFRLSFFVNNLTEEVHEAAIIITQFDNTRFFTRPRTFGARVRYQF